MSANDSFGLSISPRSSMFAARLMPPGAIWFGGALFLSGRLGLLRGLLLTGRRLDFPGWLFIPSRLNILSPLDLARSFDFWGRLGRAGRLNWSRGFYGRPACRPGGRILNASIILLLPMSALFPAAPVGFDLLVGHSLVVPGMPLPTMLPIIIPPTRRDLPVKRRNAIVVAPSRTIVPRAVPSPFPRTPPPTIVEKDVHI